VAFIVMVVVALILLIVRIRAFKVKCIQCLFNNPEVFHCAGPSSSSSRPLHIRMSPLDSPLNFATSVCDRCGSDVGKGLRCGLYCEG
jgi:hypothetical protein